MDRVIELVSARRRPAQQSRWEGRNADENKEKIGRRRGRRSSHAKDTNMDPTIADALSKLEKLFRELLAIHEKAFQAPDVSRDCIQENRGCII